MQNGIDCQAEPVQQLPSDQMLLQAKVRKMLKKQKAKQNKKASYLEGKVHIFGINAFIQTTNQHGCDIQKQLNQRKGDRIICFFGRSFSCMTVEHDPALVPTTVGQGELAAAADLAW